MEAKFAKEGKLHSPQPKRLQLVAGERRGLFSEENEREDGGEAIDLVTEEISKIVDWDHKQANLVGTHRWRRLCAMAPEREVGNPLECDELFVAVGKMDGILPWDFSISTP